MSDLSIDQSEMNVIFVHSAVDDYPLTTEEFRIYAHIARRAGGGEAWPSINSVAKKCRVHEDTARRCLHNLIAYGMVEVTERGSQGKSNLYRIAKASSWKKAEEVLALQKKQELESKAKRAAKKQAKEDTKSDPLRNEGRGQQRDPSETKGAPPSETKGAPPSETKGGPPSETKGDEVYPLKGIPLKEIQEREATPPRAQKNLDVVFEQPTPQQAEPMFSEVLDSGHQEAQLNKPTSLENVAAAGGAADVAQDSGVAAQIAPVTARQPEKPPVTPVQSDAGATEAFLRRKLNTHWINTLLEEVTPLGLDSRRDWFKIPLARAEELLKEAQRTHQQHGVKVNTRMRDLLDAEAAKINLEECGVARPEAAAQGGDKPKRSFLR